MPWDYFLRLVLYPLPHGVFPATLLRPRTSFLMSTRPNSPSLFQLELLETRMLLAVDIPWLGDAVLADGTDIAADLVTENDNGHDITVLVLHGDATLDSSITIDTSHFGATIDKIRVSNFEHVTIDGDMALKRAVVWDVGELVVETPVTASLWVADVETITFKTPLPPAIVIYAGKDVTLQAPSFGETRLFSDAETLTLVSGKASDSLDFWTTNLNQQVLLSFVPVKLTLNLSATQLDSVQHMFQIGTDTKFELPAEWIRVLPLDEFQALVEDLFATVELQSGNFDWVHQLESLPAAIAGKDSLPASPEYLALPDHAAPIALPEISGVVALPQGADGTVDLDIVPDTATNSGPLPGSDFVLYLAAKETTPVARVAPLVGSFASTAFSGVAAPSLFEPLRNLRNAIVQRFTQEFVPGVRPALLVEPRPAKSVEKKTASE